MTFTEVLKPFSHMNRAFPRTFASVDSQAFYGSFQQPSVKHPQKGPLCCPRYLQSVPMVPCHVSARGAVLKVDVVVIDANTVDVTSEVTCLSPCCLARCPMSANAPVSACAFSANSKN